MTVVRAQVEEGIRHVQRTDGVGYHGCSRAVSVDTDTCVAFSGICRASIVEFRLGSVATRHTEYPHQPHRSSNIAPHRFDRFGTWPSNQRCNRFALRYTAVCDKSIVETAMTICRGRDTFLLLIKASCTARAFIVQPLLTTFSQDRLSWHRFCEM